MMDPSRPYKQKTVIDLNRLVDANRGDTAVLRVILAELGHRKNLTAREVERRTKLYLEREDSESAGKDTGVKRLSPSASPPNRDTVRRLDALRTLTGTSWDDRGALERFLERSRAFAGDEAEALAQHISERIAELSSPPESHASGILPGLPGGAPRQEVPFSTRKFTSRGTPVKADRPSSSEQERRWTEEAVADLRRKLIDLSKRNPLINFRHSARGGSHLRIIDERPDFIFDGLDGKTFGFEPLPDEDVTPKDEQTANFQIAYERARLTDEEFLTSTEELGEAEGDAKALQEAERQLRRRVRSLLGLPAIDYGKSVDVKALARAHGFDPSFDLKNSDEEGAAEHHEDDKLRVLLTAKELEKRLKSIWDKYRGHQREMGLHTLFLVFGFVEWFEDDSSDVPLHAPLLLLPVQIDRKVRYGRYEYRLGGTGEEIELNIALVEKMRQLGLELPKLRHDEKPESYFIRVEEVLKKGRRLFLRRFATIAVLPFPRMVLWKDLDPENWSDGAFADHHLLPVLVSARSSQGPGAVSRTLDLDDPEVARRAPPLIQPADASQHSALIEIAEGKSIAIEGPPGTGKSQTITNMIAAVVRDGKRVLFVAEKQAALKVVADRLRHAGLGPLILELHSDSADRSAVYASLRKLRNARAQHKAKQDETTSLQLARERLAAKRDLLRRYLSLIRTKLGRLEKSAHWLAWRQIRLNSEKSSGSLDAISRRWQPKEPDQLTPAALQTARERLETFAKALAAIDADAADGQRTLWCEAAKLDPFDQQRQLAAAKRLAAAARSIAEAMDALAEFELGLPSWNGDLEGAAKQLSSLEGFGAIPEAVALSAIRHQDTARALLSRQTRWRQMAGRLERDVRQPSQIPVDEAERLSAALHRLGRVADTYADLVARQSKLEDVARRLAGAQQEWKSLLEGLNLTDSLNVMDLHQITAILVELDDQPRAVKALLHENLVDDLVVVMIGEERARADALKAERCGLVDHLTEAALALPPETIDNMTALIESTGVIGRIFGGRYRAAKGNAVALFNSAPQERLEMVSFLRGLAAHIRAWNNFTADSPAEAVFPSILWRGAESDWDALQQACDKLASAAHHLSSGSKLMALNRWLALGSRERGHLASSAGALTEALSVSASLGFGDMAASELCEHVASVKADCDVAIEALEHLDALPGAVLTGDDNVVDRLEIMQAAASEFIRLSSDDTFGWAGSIDQSLEELARALAIRDHIADSEGPIDVLSSLSQADTPAARLDALIAACPGYLDALDEWRLANDGLQQTAGLSLARVASPEARWPEVVRILEALAADETGAKLAADLLRYRLGLEEIDCLPFARASLSGEVPGSELPDLYELLNIKALLQSYLGGDGGELARLGGLTLEGARQAFVNIDKELQGLEAKSILEARLIDQPPYGNDSGPKSTWTELALIENELSLKRPRTPLREVTQRAGGALQILKPIWMMSPTSAAQYIQPNTLEFDLLVVDEASQMRPEFAVSALLRGKQFVVVGDANQLPPTDFFAVSDDDGDGRDEDGSEKLRVDTESILDLANARLRHRRRLKWHYRSQHESLIQFSNREFYDRDLVVFPSPTVEDDLLGVKYVYIGGTYEASINEAEAKTIVEEAFALMCRYPERSIGIATMNAKQTELIKNEFDRLVLESPDVKTYVDNYAGTIDEFFIKNLENVQGDERDIILISTVYGPDKNGVVMQRFGPMNRDVGWRRLNVLVTRAKLSTRIFTSLRPGDIKVTETSSRGLIAFRNYLTYASKGAHHDNAPGGEPDSDFEIFVADALRAAGYEVVPQVGVDGFRIDIGVRHPEFAGGFIAGVECDGASYHSGLTVRDRDRIRQTVLEQMGWNIYRVWSTDWFADPSRQTAKLLAQLDNWRTALMAAVPIANISPPLELSGTSSAEPTIAVEAHVGEAALRSDSGPPVSQGDLIDADEANRVDPVGRPMRPIDDIDWFEVKKGKLYDVWLDSRLAGSVEVLSRATAAPKVYGGELRVAKSEYEGRIAGTNERFIKHDIYAAVREVARLAGQPGAE
jgi:very-short-patch-repair endonuclease/tRNA isopentenyl-2-thiomethyl-A-37 hydroxylase MiaE